MKILIKAAEPYRPLITLNSRLLGCDGKQKKAIDLLENNEDFNGYGYDLEDNQGECIACANTSGGMSVMNVTTNEQICPPYFMDVNKFLKGNIQVIQEACSCQ